MADGEMISYLLYLVTGIVSFVLIRVWRVPSIETKLDNVARETDKNRDLIHNISNKLHHHETRISLLESAKEKMHKP